MDFFKDGRIVLTLDAGGTNFVFSALRSGKEMVESIVLPSYALNLEICLKTIIKGFRQIKDRISPAEPVAISFAFPGPADYAKGIIGDLPNFPSFRGGVALGPMLEEIFEVPTYINNDGNLFAYGEAIAGLLPEINNALRQNRWDKKYKNLFGITLGTGFGGGMVLDSKLCEGDNSAAGEIWLMRNFNNTKVIAEESVSIRAIQREYGKITGEADPKSPLEIYGIAMGDLPGDRDAALKSFDEMAVGIAESLANAITLVDGIIVIGGGISGASKLLVPRIVKHLNGKIENLQGEQMPRLASKVYNLEDPISSQEFVRYRSSRIKIPFSKNEVEYVPEKRIAVGLSRLGTSKAVFLGAYAYALDQLDKVGNTRPAMLGHAHT